MGIRLNIHKKFDVVRRRVFKIELNRRQFRSRPLIENIESKIVDILILYLQ